MQITHKLEQSDNTSKETQPRNKRDKKNGNSKI